jgi:hypothetical protein
LQSAAMSPVLSGMSSAAPVASASLARDLAGFEIDSPQEFLRALAGDLARNATVVRFADRPHGIDFVWIEHFSSAIR